MITINSEEIDRNLSMQECIGSMEELFRNESSTISSQPVRSISRIDEDSLIMTMPGYSKHLGRFAVKIVSEYRRNPDRFGMKIQGGSIMLFDAENSMLLAIIDSPTLTAIRTGAVSALATKLLSRIDSRRVGLIGSGEQARTMLEGIACVRKIDRACVYSRDFSHATSFSDEMSAKLGIPTYSAKTLEELGKNDNDILALATNSSRPVLDYKDDVTRGMHINSIGTLPDRRELDSKTIRNSRIFVDTKQGVLTEAGDIMDAIRQGLIEKSQIIGDLSDLVLGKKVGRTGSQDVTLFKSVGFSLQDVYASSKLYNMMRSEQKTA